MSLSFKDTALNKAKQIKWNAQEVVSNVTNNVVVTSGSIAVKDEYLNTLGYPWEYEVKTNIPTRVPKEQITVTVLTGLANNIFLSSTSDGYWEISFSGYTPTAGARLRLNYTYSCNYVVDPGHIVKNVYFNGTLVYGIQYDYVLLDDGTYAISYVSGAEEGSTLTLPESYNGKAIRNIRDFTSCPSATIIVPDGYTTVESSAFECCESLEAIRLPDSLSYILNNAFDGCQNLRVVDIKGCYSIGDYAFANCESIEYMTLPNDLYSLGDCTFQNCISMKALYLPSSLGNIEGVLNGEFNWSPYIYCGVNEDDITWTSAIADSSAAWFQEFAEDVPNQITYNYIHPSQLGYNLLADDTYEVYWNSPDIMPVHLCLPITFEGKQVSAIATSGFAGYNAYNEQIGPEEVTIPYNITNIGGGCFENCTQLELFEFINPNTIVGADILKNASRLYGITAPFIGRESDSPSDSEYSLLGYWFDETKNAAKMYTVVPSTLSVININSTWSPGQSRTFNYCSNIKSINLFSGITSIWSSPFVGCTGLQVFPVPGARYWRWSAIDHLTGDEYDFGAYDLTAKLTNSLSDFISGGDKYCEVYTPVMPVITTLARTGSASGYCVIKNNDTRDHKYDLRIIGKYTYGPSTSQNFSGTISAGTSITKSVSFSSTNSAGASFSGLGAELTFDGISTPYLVTKST